MPTPVSPRLAATFVLFHVAVMAVFASWYVATLFFFVVLEMSHLSPVPIGIVALLLAPAIATAVTVLFVRRLRRGKIVRWMLVTVTTAAAPFTLSFLLTGSLHAVLRTQQLTGPTSSEGLRSLVAVRDAGLGWGADFYCDVRVLDANDHVVAEWKGGSQYPRSGPGELCASMRWTSPRTLEFTASEGPQTLRVP